MALMQIKTTIERPEIGPGDFIPQPPKRTKPRALFPFAMLFTMGCAILLMDAILPLRDLWFHEAQLTQLGSWPVLPSLILFPGWTLIPPVPNLHLTGAPQVIQSWEKLPLLLSSFVLVFFIYLHRLCPYWRNSPFESTDNIANCHTLRSNLQLRLLDRSTLRVWSNLGYYHLLPARDFYIFRIELYFTDGY